HGSRLLPRLVRHITYHAVQNVLMALAGFVRAELNPKYTNLIVFKFHLIMLGIHFYRIERSFGQRPVWFGLQLNFSDLKRLITGVLNHQSLRRRNPVEIADLEIDLFGSALFRPYGRVPRPKEIQPSTHREVKWGAGLVRIFGEDHNTHLRGIQLYVSGGLAV